MEFKMKKFPNYHRKWLASEKSKYPSRNIRGSVERKIQNAEIEPGNIVCET